MTGFRRSVLLAAALATLVACGSPRPRAGYRAFSDSYVFRIDADPQPPFAREDIRYKVVVLDKDTNQPIENGEGRIFAESRDGKRTWDGFAAGPEVGTYHAKLSYLTAGDWAVALEFRRDSAAAIERIDWMQQVQAERETVTP
ncbi:MAG: hypothetical protein M3373_09315 [Gemmatimonadota bacterium]|nr:hypothetical protein [Gemmatimonadota bacterium]